jgi:hypothetical protein
MHPTLQVRVASAVAAVKVRPTHKAASPCLPDSGALLETVEEVVGLERCPTALPRSVPTFRTHLAAGALQAAEAGSQAGYNYSDVPSASWNARRTCRISSSVPPPQTRLVKRTK